MFKSKLHWYVFCWVPMTKSYTIYLVMAWCWRNCYRWPPRRLSFWQTPVQPTMTLNTTPAYGVFMTSLMHSTVHLIMIESALDISRFNLAYWYMQHNKIGIEHFSETLSLSELLITHQYRQETWRSMWGHVGDKISMALSKTAATPFC